MHLHFVCDVFHIRTFLLTCGVTGLCYLAIITAVAFVCPNLNEIFK